MLAVTTGVSAAVPVKPSEKQPGLAARRPLRGPYRRAHPARQTAHLRKKGAPGLRQFRPVRHPVEQLYAHFRLQITDLGAERWLGDAEPLRRAGKIPLFGNGQEIADMAQLHGDTHDI